jgi:hypothetical protein
MFQWWKKPPGLLHHRVRFVGSLFELAVPFAIMAWVTLGGGSLAVFAEPAVSPGVKNPEIPWVCRFHQIGHGNRSR